MWVHQSLTEAHCSSSPIAQHIFSVQIFTHPQVGLCLFEDVDPKLDSHTQDRALTVTNIIAVGHMARYHGRISGRASLEFFQLCHILSQYQFARLSLSPRLPYTAVLFSSMLHHTIFSQVLNQRTNCTFNTQSPLTGIVFLLLVFASTIARLNSHQLS